jgi:glycine cleavage system H protein
MNFPDDLQYTKDHIWVKRDDGQIVIGITFFAQLELGEIAYVEVKTAGKHLQEGQVFGTIEAVKNVSDLFLPVSGVVKELNPLLKNDPGLINKDPYETGWIIHLIPDESRNTEDLLSADQYEKLVNG